MGNIIIDGQEFSRCDTCNNFYPTFELGCKICRDSKMSKEIREILDMFKKRNEITILTILNNSKTLTNYNGGKK